MKAMLVRIVAVILGGGVIGHFLFGVSYGVNLVLGNLLGALIVEAIVWGIGKARRQSEAPTR